MASVYPEDIFYTFFENFIHASSMFDHTQQLFLLAPPRSTQLSNLKSFVFFFLVG